MRGNRYMKVIDGAELVSGADAENPAEQHAPQTIPAPTINDDLAGGLRDPILPCYVRLEELAIDLSLHGTLGLMVFDFSSVGLIEYEYGAQAYEGVRQRIMELMMELPGRSHRIGDVLALDEPGGLRFLLFLMPKRKTGLRLSISDLVTLKERLLPSVQRKMARVGFPYVSAPLQIEVGYSLALNNPLLNPKRILDRAYHQALERAALQRKADDFEVLETLQEIISGAMVVTVYQSILSLKDRRVLGFEALCRGASGTGLETPEELFAAARTHQLHVELDRLCRRRALENAGRIPKHAKIFVNTLPATIRDPKFRGRSLIEFLDRAQISPDRIVMEITEKDAIQNYNLFAETMAYFKELGMSFAVDDVGAGYSGLEVVARLKPAYLKVDIGLVREVHMSQANQEIIKAILSIGEGIGATVIAEGIQTELEVKALQTLGIKYGQGFYLSRPLRGPQLDERKG